MKPRKTQILTALFAASLCTVATAQNKPLKALLITGGCCHDYKTQKDILKTGIEARANIIKCGTIHSDGCRSAE